MSAMDFSQLLDVAHKFRPRQLAEQLPLKDIMRLSYQMLFNKNLDLPLQQYAVELLYVARAIHPIEWNTTWKNDAFLGEACEFALRYDERYVAYKQAAQKASPIPAELLVSLARCHRDPGIPPVSKEEAIKLYKEAIRERPYAEALDGLEYLGEPQQEPTTRNKEHEIHIPSLEPAFLREEITVDISKLPAPPQRERQEELEEVANYVISTREIPYSVRGIAVGWEDNEIVIWAYYEDSLDADAASDVFQIYFRIAGHYAKDYPSSNLREQQIGPPQELPHHDKWVYLRDS